MARTVDWDAVPDSTLLPEDLYLLDVEDMTEDTSKAGHMMYRGTLRVAEPKAFTGTPLYEYFTIGTTDDPTASEQATWVASIGARRLKRLFKATGIPMSPDVDEMVEAVKGQRFVAAVGQRMEEYPKGSGKSTPRNVINAMYPVGTHLPGSGGATPPPATTGPGVATPTPAKPTTAGPRAAAKAAPTVTCPFCSTTVARATYSAHVKSAHPEEG